MSSILLKASELRKPLKMMLPTSESRTNNDAKRVGVCITKVASDYGIMMVTCQVGFEAQIFHPVVEEELQKEHGVFDIQPDDTVATVDSRELDRALATFGAQDVRMTLSEKGITIAHNEDSTVFVRRVQPRQLTLPLEEESHPSWEDQLGVEDMARRAYRVPIQQLVNALMPAAKVTTMAGNVSDKRGIHLHAPEGEKKLRVVGAHEDAVYVHEMDIEQPKDNEQQLNAIISPDVAKRLREMLMPELVESMNDKGKSTKEVWLTQVGEERLHVCCDTWHMAINLLDICQTDCTAYLDMPGKNVFEVERIPLLQALNGLRMMGETEVCISLHNACVTLEGEDQTHKGERILNVPCSRYGEKEQIPVRKYYIAPMITMLSAACAAEQNRMVKLLTDGDDYVLCLQCDGKYNVFVK